MIQLIDPQPVWKQPDGTYKLMEYMENEELEKALAKANRRVLDTKARLKTYERLQQQLKDEIKLRAEENLIMETIDRSIKKEKQTV